MDIYAHICQLFEMRFNIFATFLIHVVVVMMVGFEDGSGRILLNQRCLFHCKVIVLWSWIILITSTSLVLWYLAYIPWGKKEEKWTAKMMDYFPLTWYLVDIHKKHLPRSRTKHLLFTALSFLLVGVLISQILIIFSPNFLFIKNLVAVCVGCLCPIWFSLSFWSVLYGSFYIYNKFVSNSMSHALVSRTSPCYMSFIYTLFAI